MGLPCALTKWPPALESLNYKSEQLPVLAALPRGCVPHQRPVGPTPDWLHNGATGEFVKRPRIQRMPTPKSRRVSPDRSADRHH